MEPIVRSSRAAKTTLSPNGRIVIPAAIRKELGMKPGETLLMDVVDGALHIESYRARIQRIQKEFAHLARPGVLASDELIAERRQEALLEQETFERARELRRIRGGFQLQAGQSPENPSQSDRPKHGQPDPDRSEPDRPEPGKPEDCKVG